MRERSGAVYLCYFPISDPLVESQVVAYLRGLATAGFRIHLITFEISLAPADEVAVHSRLLGYGIHWSCLRYRPGGSLLRKGWEGLRGILRLIRVVLQHNIQVIHARAHPAAMMGFPVAKILRRKFLFDVRGLIADEYAEIGRWPRSGVLFRGVKLAERVLLYRSDAVVFLTHAIVRELSAGGTLGTEDLSRITVIPCCVQVPATAPVSPGPAEFVLAYVGKLGSWYLDEEILRFFMAVRQLRTNARLMVLTQSPADGLRARLSALGLPGDAAWIGAVEHSQIENRLRHASAGVAFYKSGYSKRATSPTKVGDYLSAGLPVAINAGVGDCDELLTRNQLGVSLNGFSDLEVDTAAARLIELAESPGTRQRCREVALRELDLDRVGVARYRAIYADLGA